MTTSVDDHLVGVINIRTNGVVDNLKFELVLTVKTKTAKFRLVSVHRFIYLYIIILQGV